MATEILSPIVEEIALIERASRAYFRRFGKTADFPGCESGFEGEEVVLRNINGVLARYHYDERRDLLRFVGR